LGEHNRQRNLYKPLELPAKQAGGRKTVPLEKDFGRSPRSSDSLQTGAAIEKQAEL
jgi:hypothetical protein